MFAFDARAAICRHSAARSLHSLEVIIAPSPYRRQPHSSTGHPPALSPECALKLSLISSRQAALHRSPLAHRATGNPPTLSRASRPAGAARACRTPRACRHRSGAGRAHREVYEAAAERTFAAWVRTGLLWGKGLTEAAGPVLDLLPTHTLAIPT
jgi:hypothetical protein